MIPEPLNVPMTIPSVLAAAVARLGDREAVVEADRVLTYADLDVEARSFGAALVALGIEPGDRVAIWAPNSTDWIVALFGLEQAGATLVPINTRFKGHEAAEVLRRSKARVLVTVTDFLGADYAALVRGAGVDLPDLDVVVTIAGPATGDVVAWGDFVASGGDADLAELDRRSAAVTESDFSDILFTSGTTGTPKGVVQTHAGTVGVARDWVAMTGITDADRYLMVNPYFHMFGFKAGILASVVGGLTMYPVTTFDPNAVLQQIADYRISVLPGPPTIYQSILDLSVASDLDLTSLRVAVTGAAEIPVVLMQRVMEDMPFEVVLVGYGLSECGTVTGTAIDDPPEAHATTVGKVRPGFEIRLVDGDDEDVPDGEAGEVLTRGSTVMSHYLDDPEATAEAFTADGWFRTGDIGQIDDDGRLRIVGRAKDMFIVGGFNAYPAEIENALVRHPDIAQAAVIGIPDERMGEVAMAFVVLAPGSTVTPDEIIAWSRAEMANYKAPRRVEILDELPVNATGKVEKLVLKERAGTSRR